MKSHRLTNSKGTTMNRISQTLCISLLAASACGGTIAETGDSGRGSGDRIDGLDASDADSRPTLDAMAFVIGQACEAGSVCANGVSCLMGTCQSGNCRSGADCVQAACTHGWCVNYGGYGWSHVPSIAECLDQPDADVNFVCSYLVPIDGGLLTDCQSYPEAGVMCVIGGEEDGATFGYYCQELPNVGACLLLGPTFLADQ